MFVEMLLTTECVSMNLFKSAIFYDLYAYYICENKENEYRIKIQKQLEKRITINLHT